MRESGRSARAAGLVWGALVSFPLMQSSQKSPLESPLALRGKPGNALDRTRCCIAEQGMGFRHMWSSDIVTLADSIDGAGFQSRYARSFEVMVAVNSVAPDWLFTHWRRGKSIISVYVLCCSGANLLEAKREAASEGTNRTLFIVMR